MPNEDREVQYTAFCLKKKSVAKWDWHLVDPTSDNCAKDLSWVQTTRTSGPYVRPVRTARTYGSSAPSLSRMRLNYISVFISELNNDRRRLFFSWHSKKTMLLSFESVASFTTEVWPTIFPSKAPQRTIQCGVDVISHHRRLGFSDSYYAPRDRRPPCL